jgi:hypothetical protein
VLLALGAVGMAWAWRCIAAQDRAAQ